jgi:hypothetical protein
LDSPIIFRCFGCFGGRSNSSLPQNGIAQTANPALSVDVTADRPPISPDIYGMNHYALEPALAKKLRIPLERWGANHTSRYNWLVDSSNSGDGFFFVVDDESACRIGFNRLVEKGF